MELGNYYNFGLPLFLGISLLIGIYNSIKTSKVSKVFDKITYFIVYILFALSPILLTIYLGQTSVLRSQFFIPIIEAISMIFVIYYLCNNKYYNIIKYVVAIIISILFLEQSYMTQKLYYADYLTRQNDVQIAYQLIYDFNKLGITNDDKIYFYGHLEERISPSSIIGENIGISNFEFGYSAEPLYYFSTCNIIRLFSSLGYNLTPISPEQVNEARLNTGAITANWPKEDSIKKFDNYYIVKLGDC